MIRRGEKQMAFIFETVFSKNKISFKIKSCQIEVAFSPFL